MRKLYMILIFLMLPLFLANSNYIADSSSDVVKLKKSERAPFAGILVSRDKFNKLTIAYKENEERKVKIIEFKLKVTNLNWLVSQVTKERDFWIEKYKSEHTLNLTLQKDLKDAIKWQRVLTITTAVGFSISFAELLGVAVGAIVWYTLPQI